MAKQPSSRTREIRALQVPQWLDMWNEVAWEPSAYRREPEHWFYLFSIPATDLKALSGIYPRTTAERSRGTEDLGIQRRHENERSAEIGEFIRYGYPWSDLSKAKRESGEFDDLRKPGWLPTAIVVNILRADDERLEMKVDRHDLVNVVSDGDSGYAIRLPENFT
jgi:hypothetical protein